MSWPEYPIAQVKGGKNGEAGAAFIALVLSEEGQRVLQQYGLLPAGAGAPSPAAAAKP